ncbi:MAG: lysine exporter protein LysE/YggA [Parcubacteria group bacterium Gr01-1014_31]|nr:MAG: lysine exporter protein LysE/YggA [Parcubacteria group bacterium Gr01-1014_31]
MPYLSEFFVVLVVHLLAVMSPGPDFVLISRNSLIYSKRTAISTALGLALGILVHVTYSLVGIGFIISRSVLLFSALKLLGAGYLVYIGYRSFRAAAPKADALAPAVQRDPPPRTAIRTGFLTNVLNPKATLFFFALFTQVINPKTPKMIQVFYGLEMSLMTFIWFSVVAAILSHRLVKKNFSTVQHRLERAFGVVLMALGIKVALSSTK